MRDAEAATSLEVVIVDDEPVARRTLREYCATEPDLQVIGEHGDTQSALAALRAHTPDILFLDIQIDDRTGLDLARSLDPERLPLLVFVTAYDHYALEAFEVSAADYLLKPFDEERFRRTVERLRARRREGAARRERALTELLELLGRGASAAGARPRILAESGSRLHMLNAALIEMIEADRNYVRLQVGGDSFHARSTLQQAEATLKAQPMLKISRSCLVNMNHVKEISRTPRGDFILVLAGGRTVTSSEGHRDAVRQYLERLKLAPA